MNMNNDVWNTNNIINIRNPSSILQQEKSNIITNPFIPNEQREREIEVIQTEANNIIEKSYNEHTSIANITLKSISVNISNSFVGFLNDLFEIPDNSSYISHFGSILHKDQRYAYFGIVFVIVAVILLIIQK